MISATAPSKLPLAIILTILILGTIASVKSGLSETATNEAAKETLTPTSAPTSTPLPTIVKKPLIDCVGPDDKHAQATQADCDALNAFWKTQTSGSNITPTQSSLQTGTTVNFKSNTNVVPFPTQNTGVGNTSTPTPPSNTSGTITVSTNSVNVTLSRANAQYGLIYGSGFTITSQGATGWQIHYNEGTSGQGFYESSGGINPGSSSTIRSYINANKSNGTYTGSAVVEYNKNGSWQAGPTVSYSITLTD